VITSYTSLLRKISQEFRFNRRLRIQPTPKNPKNLITKSPKGEEVMSVTGPSALEQRIERFEELLEEMRAETREAHSTLKAIRNERREIERLFKADDVSMLVEKRVTEVVKTKLDEIGPEIRDRTTLVYDKVGQQIDKLIDLSLGKKWTDKHSGEDLRPALAEKLKIWIREVIDKEGYNL
jgi:hypothetical protein